MLDLRFDLHLVTLLEPFGRDTYLRGTEFRRFLSGGDYRVEVCGRAEKCVLIIGRREAFRGLETPNTLRALAVSKRFFFGRSPLAELSSLAVIAASYVALGISVLLGIIWRIVSARRRRGQEERGGCN